MNLLELVPSFKRQIRQYIRGEDTDSILAGYLADAIDALNWRWSRTYVVTNTIPNTYIVDTDITPKDIRPVVLMASIIYKVGSLDLASFKDGDFAYDPTGGRNVDSVFATELAELNDLLPVASKRLGLAASIPLRGFSNVYNPESYSYLLAIGAFGSI